MIVTFTELVSIFIAGVLVGALLGAFFGFAVRPKHPRLFIGRGR